VLFGIANVLVVLAIWVQATRGCGAAAITRRSEGWRVLSP